MRILSVFETVSVNLEFTCVFHSIARISAFALASGHGAKGTPRKVSAALRMNGSFCRIRLYWNVLVIRVRQNGTSVAPETVTALASLLGGRMPRRILGPTTVPGPPKPAPAIVAVGPTNVQVMQNGF